VKLEDYNVNASKRSTAVKRWGDEGGVGAEVRVPLVGRKWKSAD